MKKTIQADNHVELNHARFGVVNILVQILIILLIVLPPLAMGAVAPWARAAVNITIFIAFGVWFLDAVIRGRLYFLRSRAWLFIAIFLALLTFQLAPLPAGILRTLSPGTAETYDKVLPGGLTSGQTLSLFPYGTKAVLIRLIALAMLFTLVTHFVRARWQIIGILIALLAIGLFETFYGFAEHFSGRNHIFWHQRVAHLYAVTGTYLNKNHFAGLMEMIVPASLGLALGLIPRGEGPKRLSARAAGILSSKQWMMAVLCMAAVLIFALGICFSVSRAGIACLAASFCIMAIFLGISSGFRKYTLLLLILAMAVPLTAAAIGAEIVAQHMEPIIAGKSVSWIDRIDLARSGISMAKRFPLFGTGAGTFQYAFERFQSVRIGDRVADYLHNDWLQLFCEYGLIGAGILIAGLFILIGTTLRKAVTIRDPFRRWTTLGALCGACVLLLHSFFDYNLSKIVANSVIFTILMGMAVAGTRSFSKDEKGEVSSRSIRIAFGPLPIRITLALVLAIFLGLLVTNQIREAQADIACNRFLSQNPKIDTDPYSFIPLTASTSETNPTIHLDQALKYTPTRPRFYYYLALYRLHEAEVNVLNAARKRAQNLVGNAENQENTDAIERLAQAFARRPSDFAGADITDALNNAEDTVRHALDLQPVSARHNLLMAEILATKRDITKEATSEQFEAETYARRALWLGSTRPYVLQAASVILLKQASADPEKSRIDQVWAETSAFLRAAIASDPTRSDEIYTTVWGIFGTPQALFSVTPYNLKAYSQLARMFWKEQRWEAVLACLDEMDKMVAARAIEGGKVEIPITDGENNSSEEENADFGSLAYDRRTPTEIAIEISRLRGLTLSVLGRWEERTEAAATYQTLLRQQAETLLAEAQQLCDRRNYEEALYICRQTLLDDWSNPKALLIAASAAHALQRPSVAPYWESALDQLYRLAIYNDSLSEEEQSHAREVLAQITPNEDEERIVKQFILALLDMRKGDTENAESEFRSLLEDKSRAALYWRQRHLIRHYLGLLAEARDATDEAIQFYRQTLNILPTHRDTLLRLSALGENTTEQLAAITPDVVCNVNFGGKITLIGYTIDREDSKSEGESPNNDAPWRITYVWEFHDRMFQDYHPIVHFCDSEWKIVFQNDHRIREQSGLYPVDFPARGEVVNESAILYYDIGKLPFLRVGIWSAEPPQGLSRTLRPKPEKILSMPLISEQISH